jgi:hypothetical protein
MFREFRGTSRTISKILSCCELKWVVFHSRKRQRYEGVRKKIVVRKPDCAGVDFGSFRRGRGLSGRIDNRADDVRYLCGPLMRSAVRSRRSTRSRTRSWVNALRPVGTMTVSNSGNTLRLCTTTQPPPHSGPSQFDLRLSGCKNQQI